MVEYIKIILKSDYDYENMVFRKKYAKWILKAANQAHHW